MWVPTLLFLLFAVFSAAGVYLIVAHHRNRTAAVLGAFVTLLLYLALYAGVLYLIRPLDNAG
jgi:drug/metabolite transporter superfamily protein YnfA